MKTIIIMCLVFYGMHYLTEMAKREKLAAQDAEINMNIKRPTKQFYGYTAPSSKQSSESFRCDGRVYCSQMNSKAEAIYYINNCPGTKMDGDHDGEPCEQQFR